MTKNTLPLPPHFDPASVGRLWRLPYQERAAQARDWAAQHGIGPSAQDNLRTCLLLIDCQNTFCLPDFELFVGGRSGTGAVEDNVRLCQFIYHHLDRITHIIATLDTHFAMQIFHSEFFVDGDGRHPPPMTSIEVEDIEQGRWQVNLAAANRMRGLNGPIIQRDDDALREYVQHYCDELKRRGKFSLMVWPYHAMFGGVGHALVPAIEEACFFHNIARHSQTSMVTKGDRPLTENYSALSPEVLTDPQNRPVGQKNQALIDELFSYDQVIIAGQAMSHCVAWTVQDFLREIKTRDPSWASNVQLLDDCTSPVVIPGVIDFTNQADAAFSQFRDAGMNVGPTTGVQLSSA